MKTASLITAFLAAALLGTANQPAWAVSVDPAVEVGMVASATLNEISGVVGSRSMTGTLWVHNDSGDSARFFAISTGGGLLGQYSLSGVSAIDWEDMAIGPKPGGDNYLYLADIGDNGAVRSQVAIRRVTEPLSAAGGAIALADQSQLLLQYPGGPRDAESMLVDPISGELFIISKSLTAGVYRAPASAFGDPQPVMLSLLGNLGSGVAFATAADISPDGKYILVRGYSTTAYLFERGPGESVGDALLAPGMAVTLHSEPQGESIGWAADGSGFYTISEGLSQPIYFYGVTVPEPMGAMLGGSGLAALLAWIVVRKARSARVVCEL